jgi:predicted TIM-barrel fold metal-dependent hydrolase
MRPPQQDDDEAARLHEAGIRGLQCMMLASGLTSWNTLPADAARIAPLRWRIDVQSDGRDLRIHESAASRIESGHHAVARFLSRQLPVLNAIPRPNQLLEESA